MKKFLAGLLALMLLLGSALAEGLTPTNAPITIDGVRTAFFAPDGAYLQSMEKDGLLYVPVLSLGENLGLEVTADPDTMAVTIGGIRAAFFAEDGAYLSPVNVNGAVYVPLAAFAETAGVNLAVDGDTYALGSQSKAEPASVSTPEPEHPEYVAVDLTKSNFGSYFSYSISAENFKKWEEKTRVGYNTLYFQHWSCDYVLNVTAKTGYKFENVMFGVSRAGKSHELDAKGVTFSGLTMPQSGEMTRTQAAKGSYFNSWAVISKATDLFSGSTTLDRVSGKIYIPWEDAQAALENKYQFAQKAMDEGNYQSAVNTYKELAESQYKDSAAKLAEAQQKLAEQKAQKQRDDYAAAQAALENGDYAAAIKGFKALGDYEDSQSKLAEATEKKNSAAYEAALALEKDGQYAEAIAAFKALGDYEDSAQRVTACEEALVLQGKKADYAAAQELEAQGDYVAAYAAFKALGDFEDSAQRAGQLVRKKDRQQIDQLMAEAKYNEAQTLLAAYADEEWAQQLIRTCNLRGLGNILGFNADGTSWVNVQEKDEKGNLVVKSRTLMDIHGNLLLPVDAFTHLSYATSDNNWVSPNWQDGLCLVQTAKGPHGYINTQGEMVIPAQYLYAQEFHQGAALVRTQAKKYQVIDTKGQVLAELPDKTGRDYISYVGEGLVTFKEKGKVGLLNLKGKVVLKPKYDKSISQFNHGMAIVTGLQKKLIAYGVINAKGKEVIKLGKFNPDAILSENLISIKSDIKKKDGVINTKGKVVLDQKYKNARRSGDLIIAKKSGIGAMDLNLNTVVSFSYDSVTVGYQSKVVMLKKNGVYNIYNINDLKNPLIEGGSYTARISVDSPYIAWYDNDKGWFVYDSQGNLIH